jgi:hypothetical protein
MPRVPVRTADLGRIADISDVRVNAGGSVVAAVARASVLTDNHRDAAVVVVAADGESPARVLPVAGRVEILPRWSPGGWVLATAAEDDGGWQLRLLPRTGSPLHQLQRLDLMIEWFERWLAPAATVPGGADSG